MVAATSGNVLFTGPTDDFSNQNDGGQAANDFFAGDDTDELELGRFRIALNPNVHKEDLTEFALNGGDTVHINFNSSDSLSAYDWVYLTEDGDDCHIGSSIGAFTTYGSSGTISFSGAANTQMQVGYHLCLNADGVSVIPLANSFNTDLEVEYFNIRYLDSMYNNLGWNGLTDNGCTVTLFNVPNPNSGDTAFIRLTNITDFGGRVRADMWDEAGNLMPGTSDLTDYLDPHATAVYTSDPSAPGSSVYLGDHVPLFDSSSARSRVVLRGSFPTCEAIGLVRSPNGTLTNMTSTTYNGPDYFIFDNPVYGNDTNGTSNTQN
jgi:hypothetical protein